MLQEERRGHASREDGGGEDCIGGAPAEPINESGAGEREDECASADASDRHTRREPPPAGKPALHGADGGDVGEAHTNPDTEAVGDIDLPEGLGGACEEEAGRYQQHAGEHHAPRADPVGKRPGKSAEAEVEEAGDGEDE